MTWATRTGSGAFCLLGDLRLQFIYLAEQVGLFEHQLADHLRGVAFGSVDQAGHQAGFHVRTKQSLPEVFSQFPSRL